MKPIFLVLSIVAITVAISSPNAAQPNVCSKQVDDKQIQIKVVNKTDKPFTVNWVDHECKESKSNEVVAPGQTWDQISYKSHAFRVREVGSNKLLKEIVASPSTQKTVIGSSSPTSGGAKPATVAAKPAVIGPRPTMAELVKDPNPRQSFLKTLNGFRSARKLPAMQLDNSLNQACQWLTDVMAKHDQIGHDPVEIGMRKRVNDPSYRTMREPADRMRHFNYPGQPGVEAAGMDFGEVDAIGGSAALGWAMSSTHYRPFLSMEGQVFKQVGFGFTKVPNTTNKYYTCAVFGNPKP
jgi:uncharacterized protein YkwD